MSRLKEVRARLDAAAAVGCAEPDADIDALRESFMDENGWHDEAADLYANAAHDLRDLLAVAEEAAKQHQHCWCAEKAAVDVEVFGCPMVRALARLDTATDDKPTASRCCRDNVPHAGGFHQEDERWSCPECGTRWIHVIEESQGAWWQRAETQEATR